jgi:hypothetical protein
MVVIGHDCDNDCAVIRVMMVVGVVVVASKCQLECFIQSETQSLHTVNSALTSSSFVHLLWHFHCRNRPFEVELSLHREVQLRFMVLVCACL